MNKPIAEHTLLNEIDDNMDQTRRGSVFLMTLLFSTGLLAGCAHIFYDSYALGLLQLVVFLALGTAYVFYQPRISAADSSERFTESLFFVIALLLALGIFSFFAGAFRFGLLLSFGSAFLFPSAVAEAWRLFRTFSVSTKPVWVYAKDIPTDPPFVYLENKPIHIAVNIEGRGPEYCTSLAPLSLPLGLAFFYAFKEHRTPEEWQDYFLKADGQPYRWVFYTKQLGFLKSYLNPTETLYENNVRSKTMITAERLEESWPEADAQ